MEQNLELVKHCFLAPVGENDTSDPVTSGWICVDSLGHTYICEPVRVLDDHAIHAPLTPPPPQPHGVSCKDQGNHQNGSCQNCCHGYNGVRVGTGRLETGSSLGCKLWWRLRIQQG